MAMKMMTKEILNKLPKLYETDGKPLEEKIAVVRFFNPCGSGTWYGVEYDHEDNLFFGLAFIHEWEWGYFSLTELENIRLRGGLKIERDLYFKPTKVSEISELKSYLRVS